MRARTLQNTLAPLLACTFLVSCSGTAPDTISVTQEHLKKINPTSREAPMIRGEEMYRLRGAISKKERKARMGNYYTVAWKTHRPSRGKTHILMEYIQGSTGSRIHRIRHSVPRGHSSGKHEFRITGKAYQENGPVLAWRFRLMQNGRLLDQKRSNLWQ